MSAGNDYWPAKVETMRKIEANLQAKLAEQAETIERLRHQMELLNAHPPLLVDAGTVTPLLAASDDEIERLEAERDRLRAALHGVGRWLHSKEGTSLPQPLLDQINAALRGAEPKPLPTESAKISDPTPPVSR